MSRTIDIATELAEGFALPPFGIPLDDMKKVTLAGNGARLHARQLLPRFDEEVIPFITSVHLACGVHSGDPVLIRRVASDLKSRGAQLGAHPSYPDGFGFGQKRIELTDDELEAVLLYQFGALSAVLDGIGARMAHVKFHGALSFDVSYEERFCAVMAKAVKKFDPEMIVILMAESPGLAFGKAKGLRVASEGYVDRGYDRTGRLVPRDHPQAMLTKPEEAVKRIEELVCEGKVTCVDGSRINLPVDTVCLHSDTAGAGVIAAAVAAALKNRGVTAAALG